MGKGYCFLTLATALALAVVWQGAELRDTGYRAQELRDRISEQKARRQIYLAHLSKLKSPQRITRLVAYLGLDLEEPAARPGVQLAGEGAPASTEEEAAEVSVATAQQY
ncbi:MAG: hypothetical protein ACOC7T_03765 [Planctomycetota bacterium]